MAISSQAAVELLNIAPSMVFYKEYSMMPMVHPEFNEIGTSGKAWEESNRVGGLGTFVRKNEGTPVAYDEPVVGARKRSLHATYALGVRIPMELVEDDQFNIVARFPADLGESARDHQERLNHAPWNDAFAGAIFTGMAEGDGTRRSLCNTGHVPMKAGGTQSNRLNPGVAFSQTALQDAITILRLTQNEEGRQTPLVPGRILIHPNEEWNVAVVLETTQVTHSNENDINPVTSARMGIQNTMSPYLTDTDAWFLIARRRRRGAVKFWRRKGVTTDRSRDSDTFDSKHTAHYRGHVTVDEFRPVVGSSPGN